MEKINKILVYADVNMNILDGSSIWAASIMETLATDRNSNIYLFLKSRQENDLLLNPLFTYSNIEIINLWSNKELQEKYSFTFKKNQLSPNDAFQFISLIDKDISFDTIIIRGSKAIAEVLKFQAIAQKSIIYAPLSQDELAIMPDLARKVRLVACQTEQVMSYYRKIGVSQEKLFILPPMIPDPDKNELSKNTFKLIYAGKFSPIYYPLEITEAFHHIVQNFPKLQLHFVGNKFHNSPFVEKFEEKVKDAMRSHSHIYWHEGVHRQVARKLIAESDLGIAWRSEVFNESFELSTKLLEYGGLNKPVVLNRNKMHEDLLGIDYPLYANSQEEFIQAICKCIENESIYKEAANRMSQLSSKHTFTNVFFRIKDKFIMSRDQYLSGNTDGKDNQNIAGVSQNVDNCTTFEDKKTKVNFLSDVDEAIAPVLKISPLINGSTHTSSVAIKALKNLRIIGIMDEWSYHAFYPECQLIQISPANWQDVLVSFKPQILFVESMWANNSKWQKNDHPSEEFLALINWCRANNIQTAFWNKEEPEYQAAFINVAFLFDYIFTIDIDSIKQYKILFGHNEVYFLPFACQPSMQNPVEKYVRKDKFCFFDIDDKNDFEIHRNREVLISVSEKIKSVDIYEKNLRVKMLSDEINGFYKNYRYVVHLDLDKQSQSKFSRLIYEWMASNTLVVSNYSHSLRNFFGDLVVSTDNEKLLQELILDRIADEMTYRKYRLIALRKVMSQHTYADRLQYINECIFGIYANSLLPTIYVVALAKTENDAQNILKNYQRQTYENKKLFLIMSEAYPYLEDFNRLDIHVFTVAEAKAITLGQLNLTGFMAGIMAEDYYGKSYLLDLVLATRYSVSPIIGKFTKYLHDVRGQIILLEEGKQYQQVDSISARAGIIKSTLLVEDNLFEWANSIPTTELNQEECLAIDEFNYCKNGGYLEDGTLTIVNDLENINLGNDLKSIYKAAENINIKREITSYRRFEISNFLKKFIAGGHGNIDLKEDKQSIKIISNLAEKKHVYTYIEEFYKPKVLNFTNKACFYLDLSPGLDVKLVMLFFNAKKERIHSVIASANRNHFYDLPEETAWVQLGIRVSGSGSAIIKNLFLEEVDCGSGCLISGNRYLIVSNKYPEYGDLYRNAFLYRRVCEYKKKGISVDIFQFNINKDLKFSEFENVNIITGNRDQLKLAIEHGSYDKILVHFLTEEMWSILRRYLSKIQMIVWIHGSEIQPWFRREFNISNTEEKKMAIMRSNRRTDFWRSLLLNQKIDIHYVFVSKYFFEEVMEDLHIQLSDQRCSIIHNYIDTDLFSYRKKDISQRLKILSISAYASKKYANDLTTKTILELSKTPIFSELEFKLVGDGPLFEENARPLLGFPNVSIERRFITQTEISELHKDYGVFLCPTRWDSQGVSRGEAMASGLVPVTNNVSAIPEFLDEQCGLAVPAEDYMGLAEAIKKLYLDPELFKKLSQNAANRVRKQVGLQQTIAREIELIRKNCNYSAPIQPHPETRALCRQL